MATTSRKLFVYLCGSPLDRIVLGRLYEALNAEKWITPWSEDEDILPGQDWAFETRNAVRRADAILVCVSRSSTSREGYVQKQIRYVLDVAEEIPEGQIFIIPIRLEDCEMPRRLRDLQWLDYFSGNDPKSSYDRLLQALQIRARSLGLFAE